MFTLIRTVFQSGRAILDSHLQCMSPSCSTISSLLDFVRFFILAVLIDVVSDIIVVLFHISLMTNVLSIFSCAYLPSI